MMMASQAPELPRRLVSLKVTIGAKRPGESVPVASVTEIVASATHLRELRVVGDLTDERTSADAPHNYDLACYHALLFALRGKPIRHCVLPIGTGNFLRTRSMRMDPSVEPICQLLVSWTQLEELTLISRFTQPSSFAALDCTLGSLHKLRHLTVRMTGREWHMRLRSPSLVSLSIENSKIGNLAFGSRLPRLQTYRTEGYCGGLLLPNGSSGVAYWDRRQQVEIELTAEEYLVEVLSDSCPKIEWSLLRSQLTARRGGQFELPSTSGAAETAGRSRNALTSAIYKDWFFGWARQHYGGGHEPLQ
jgi:hypothetical protein